MFSMLAVAYAVAQVLLFLFFCIAPLAQRSMIHGRKTIGTKRKNITSTYSFDDLVRTIV